MMSDSIRHKRIARLPVVLGGIALWACLPVMAQDVAGTDKTAAPPAQVSVADGAGKTTESRQPLMSEAAEAPAPQTLATTTQSGYAVMDAGVCSVVEEVVRQFCAANPGDISCQFQ